MRGQRNERAGPVPALLFLVIGTRLLQTNGPVVSHEVISAWAALGWLLVVSSGCTILAWALDAMADALDWIDATTVNDLHGSAGFITDVSQIKRELPQKHSGPYWGMLNGKPLFIPYKSNVLTIGPPGASKGTASVVPNILSIRASKIVLCFKGELTAMLHQALRDRGERVRILNLGGIFQDLFGSPDAYNPLHLIWESLGTPGRLGYSLEDAREMSLQLYPDKGDGAGNERFFHGGTVDILTWIILYLLFTEGKAATLGKINLLINDRARLHREALYAAGQLT